MQSSRKRLTKEELHEDEFTATMFKLIGYLESNYPKVLAALGVVAVVIVIGYFIQHSANRRTQTALAAIGDVQVALMQGNTSSAATKAQTIIRDYSGENIAGRALVTLANIYFDQGRYDEATAHYRQFLDVIDDPRGPEGFGANAGIAAAMEAQGNLAGAAQEYASYADRFAQTPFAPLALKEAGRCYLAAGDLDQAKQTYLRIRGEYRASPSSRIAQTELEILGILTD